MTNNNQGMLEDVKVESANKIHAEQLEKLLTNEIIPTVVPAKLPVPIAEISRRKSENSLFGSLSRIRLSIGAGSKDVPNGHVFSR